MTLKNEFFSLETDVKVSWLQRCVRDIENYEFDRGPNQAEP